MPRRMHVMRQLFDVQRVSTAQAANVDTLRTLESAGGYAVYAEDNTDLVSKGLLSALIRDAQFHEASFGSRGLRN